MFEEIWHGLCYLNCVAHEVPGTLDQKVQNLFSWDLNIHLSQHVYNNEYASMIPITDRAAFEARTLLARNKILQVTDAILSGRIPKNAKMKKVITWDASNLVQTIDYRLNDRSISSFFYMNTMGSLLFHGRKVKEIVVYFS